MLESNGSKAILSYFYPIMQGISAAILLVRVEMGQSFSYEVVVNTLLWLTSSPFTAAFVEKSKKHGRCVGLK